MELRGRVALVTGASSGIGAAVADRLAAGGAHVLVHGRDATRTEQVARRVGGTALLGDLRDGAAAETLVQRALADHGTVDVLVANAGVGWSGPFNQMPADDLERLLAVDLHAPLRITRALLPAMVDRGSGHLCFIGSVAGRTGVAGEAVYAAAKAGLDAFAESLRAELHGSGVGVSVVVPAAVATPFFDTRGRPYDRRLPRPVSADRVAATVIDAIVRDRADRWVPGWVRISSTVRALAPGTFRRLALRYGEPVRTGPEAGDRR